MGRPTISVVVNTLNEAHNLAPLLAAMVPWADEVVVVDMHSDDGTAELARSMGARVFDHPRTGYVEPAREFALARASGDWVLLLDADEIPHPRLAHLLRAVADADVPYDVVLVPRLEIMLGRPIMHGGWWPLRKPRFFRRGALEVTAQIHHGLQPKAGSRVRRLRAAPETAIWHFSHLDLHDYVEKANRYTSIEGRQLAADGWRPRRPHLLLLPIVIDVWWRYIRGRGYRDGTPGLALAIVRAFERYLRAAKAWEEPQIEARSVRVGELKGRMVALYGAGEAAGAWPGVAVPRRRRLTALGPGRRRLPQPRADGVRKTA